MRSVERAAAWIALATVAASLGGCGGEPAPDDRPSVIWVMAQLGIETRLFRPNGLIHRSTCLGAMVALLKNRQSGPKCPWQKSFWCIRC